MSSGRDPRIEEGHQVKTKELGKKYELQLIIYQHWFINCNERTILMKMLMTGETGRRVYGNSLSYRHNFSANPKPF